MPKKSMDKKSDIGVLDKQKNKLQPPRKFKVILHNDDYTSFDFVEKILMQIFHKSVIDAKAIARSVHETGRGVAGVYPKSIAETKSHKVNATASAYGLPLLSEIEPE